LQQKEDIVPMTVRILKGTQRQLDELAAADLRSTSNLVRKILEDYVREHIPSEPYTASSVFAVDDDDEDRSAGGPTNGSVKEK
jgi:hypothetical protein